MQSDGSYNSLSDVVHGDTALSINTIQKNVLKILTGGEEGEK